MFDQLPRDRNIDPDPRQPEEMPVRARCTWQGREDGYFKMRTTFWNGAPKLHIPSPLQEASTNEGMGIFGNDGAEMSSDCVRLLRDQLTAWLEEHDNANSI